MACTTDYRLACNHCDPDKKAFFSSVKALIGANECWGHTAYFMFQFGNGIYEFSEFTIRYSGTELATLTWNGERNYEPWDMCPSSGTFDGETETLPASWPVRSDGVDAPYCFPYPFSEDQSENHPYEFPIEVSTDGVNWTKIASVPFGYWKTGQEHTVTLSSSVQARFIRIRCPEDVNDVALCGYLDSARINFTDLSQVSSDDNIVLDEGTFSLTGGNSMDSMGPSYTASLAPPPPGATRKLYSAKTRYYHCTTGAKECQDITDQVFFSGFWGDYCNHGSGPRPGKRYHFSAGAHAATYFAGPGKKWSITELSGTVTLASFRKGWFSSSSTVELRIQASMNGYEWIDVATGTAQRDGSNQFTLTFDTPIEARFIRVFPKPANWSNGSIPLAWVADVDLQLTSGGGNGDSYVDINDTLRSTIEWENTGSSDGIFDLYIAIGTANGATPGDFTVYTGVLLENQSGPVGSVIQSILDHLHTTGDGLSGWMDVMAMVGQYDATGGSFTYDDYLITTAAAEFEPAG